MLGFTSLLGTLVAVLVSARHTTLFATLRLLSLASPRQLPQPLTSEPNPESSRFPSHPLAIRDSEIMAATSHIIPLIDIGTLILATICPLAGRARYDPPGFPVQAMNALD